MHVQYTTPMQARVWRLYQRGERIERDKLRQSSPAVGELALRLRLGGRGERYDVYLACLMNADCSYVVPALDGAKLVEVRGRWMRLAGFEVIPRGASVKRLSADRYRQEWWCRL